MENGVSQRDLMRRESAAGGCRKNQQVKKGLKTCKTDFQTASLPFCRFSDGLWSVDCQQTLFHHVFNHAHYAAGDGVGYLLVDFVADAVGQIVAQPLIGFFAAAE